MANSAETLSALLIYDMKCCDIYLLQLGFHPVTVVGKLVQM